MRSHAIYQFITLPAVRASRAAGSYCGFLGGRVGAVFNAGGPFYVIYLTLRGLDKTSFRATFAANYLVDCGVRLAACALAGFFHREMLPYLVAAIPVAAAGLFIGGRVHTGLS
jgi:hypothetical protein